MNQLYEDLDQNEDALVEQRAVQIKPAGPLAFNKQEELFNKYAIAAPKMEESKPAPNIFSKKRPIDEISKRVEQIQVNNSSDVEMEEQLPSAIKAADDSMATENFHSAIDDSKF